jgi:hypothetical protein
VSTNVISNDLENKLLDHVLGGTAYTPASTIYVALCTAAVTDSDTGTTITEPTGWTPAYARKAITYSAASGRACVSSGDVAWSTLTAGSSTVTHIAICDALTLGNILWYGELDFPMAYGVGDTPELKSTDCTASFVAGGMSTYLANKLLDLVLRNQAYSQPTIYAALATTTIVDSDNQAAMDEADYTGYDQVAVSSWDAAVAGVADNTSTFSFGACTGGSNTVTDGALLDGDSGANILFYGALASSLAVTTGVTPRFPAGEWDNTMN